MNRPRPARGYDRQSWRRLGVVVWLVVAQLTRASAQVEPPTLTVTVAPDIITVGDPLTVVLAVDHAADTAVVWPVPLTVEPLELIDTRLPPSTPNGERLRSTLELVVTAFELGALSMPAFSVQVIGRDGDRVDLTAEAPDVTIASVGRDDEAEIRDIKGPLTIPFNVLTLWPWVAGLVILGLIGYLLYRRGRRVEQPGTPVPATPLRPPHALAHAALDALVASGLLELGEVKTYHIRVSDIMRIYVEGRFGIDAMEMTTPEVLGELRRVGAGREVVTGFRQLLDRCDLVKFAKLRPELPSCREVVPAGRRMVDLTTPRDEVAITEADVA